MEEAAIYSYWNQHLLWIWIFLPCMQSASAKNTIYGFTECFIHYHGILHSITPNQKITSQQMNCSNRSMLLESCSFHFSINLKQMA